MNRDAIQFAPLAYRVARIAALILLPISHIGCTHVQLYDSKRPSNEISIIKPYSAFQEYGVGGKDLVYIMEVDGTKAGADGFGEIKTLPGRHSITAELQFRRSKSHHLFETKKLEVLNFETEAGKEYLVHGRHGGPTGSRIWISEIGTGKVVAGNAPPAHITPDKHASIPFVKPVWIYSEAFRMFGQVVYERHEGTLIVNNGSVLIQSCIAGDSYRGCTDEKPKVSIENIQKIVPGKFYTDIGYGVREEEGRDLWIEAIFLHYIESGKAKYLVLTGIPSDSELDSYIYSALLRANR
ncbi:MAG TPA: hypothetical protein VGD24_09785 [Gallionella sp.]